MKEICRVENLEWCDRKTSVPKIYQTFGNTLHQNLLHNLPIGFILSSWTQAMPQSPKGNENEGKAE